MKRGKDDEKMMGPMFPRLHVNDTEKGGPRAPPRNKMALYEQLTIPSQRYNNNSGANSMPLNPSSNNSLAPSTSTNPGTGQERNMYFPLYRPPSTPSYQELQPRHAEALNLNNQPAQVERRKEPLEEDDFMVPIFSEPEMGQCNSKTQNNIDGERSTHLNSDHPIAILSSGDKETNPSSNGDLSSRQDVINQDRNHRLRSLETTDACLHEDAEDGLPVVHTRYGEGDLDVPLGNAHKEISLRQKNNPHIRCGYNKIDNGIERIEDDHSPGRENIDKGDDLSETSMVDSASELDISPDDVVGILGQKHFWKARTAIVRQQRVFAVQVFELHRLIEVQRLFAGCPDLLLEGSAFVGKSSLKASAVKIAYTIKHRDDSQKPTDKMEGTAENAVVKVLPVPCQNDIQPTGHNPFSVNPLSSPPVNTDPKMNPWSFHQPTAQQWLVPVMSPSEGLVYKPCSAPGFMGPICGGCGPVGPTPVLMNPAYPGIPFGGQGYFPPYGMPMMSPSVSGPVDQMNVPNPYGPMGQKQQSPCNKPIQKDGPMAPAPAGRAHLPKGGELQSTASASNPSERSQGTKVGDSIPLIPTASMTDISEGGPPTEKRARVIRVVPHNPGCSRESAARIFQSIQEERQQFESN